MFLVTSDGDTPLGVVSKDRTQQGDDENDSCFHYLTGGCVHNNRLR